MDKIGNEKWRNAHTSYSHVSPQHVHSNYTSYAEAVYALGRPDLAEALQARISADLCEKFPALLHIIKQVAQNPLGRDLPVFQRQKPLTWTDIVAENPLTGDHWEEQYFSDLSDADMQIEDPQPQIGDQSTENEPRDLDPAVFDPPTRLVVPQIPADLTTQQLIQEIKYSLLGYNSLLFTTNSPLKSNAWPKVLAEVQRLMLITDNLSRLSDHPQAGNAFSEIKYAVTAEINACDCATLLSALAHFRRLLLPYAYTTTVPDDYIEMLNVLQMHECFPAISEPFRRQLELWVSTGKVGPILSVYKPSIKEFFDNSFELNFPNSLYTKALVDAGKNAYFCSTLGIELELHPLKLDHTLHQTALQLNELLCTRLMDRLKPLLHEKWTEITQIYLTRDTRVLEFIYHCIDNGVTLTDVRERAQAISILKMCYPDPPFTLGHNMVPKFSFQYRLIELILPVEELEDQWLRTFVAVAENRLAPNGTIKSKALEVELYNRAVIRCGHRAIDDLREVTALELPEPSNERAAWEL